MGASADLTRRTTYWLHRRKSGAALLWCFGSSNCKVFHLRTSAVSQRREESHQLLTKMFEHFSLGNLKVLENVQTSAELSVFGVVFPSTSRKLCAEATFWFPSPVN